MTRYLRPLALGALCLLPGVLAAQELPPLSEVEVVTEGLIQTAIAYEIGEVCESIDGRKIAGIAFLWSLHSEARRLGYSREEIEAFVDDDVEKDRLEAIARERLAGMGAVEGSPDTYCEVGRAEIAAGTQVGRLLSD